MKAAVVVLLICATLATAVSLRDARQEFIKFQRQYQKVYSSSELNQRFAIFKDNLEKAERHQTLNPKAKFGTTKFMDLSEEEFARYYLNRNISSAIPKIRASAKTDFSKKFTSSSAPMGPDPSNWDWFQQGYCTPVYDQGQCGSCWAFSATETIESYFALAGNQLTQLSMEQIVDCDTGDYGCNGGFPENAYQYVEQAGGLDPLSDYPYTAGNGEAGSCQFQQSEVVATVSSYNSVSGESGLYAQASTAGPVSVCVDASSWQYYQGGVLTSCTNNVDHCVQLTGYANYGTSNAYWIVRNSWGTSWGENGFIWVAIGQDLCSIGDYATIVAASPGN